MPVEKLKKQDIFQLLRSEQVNRLSEASKVAEFKAGDTVYERGAPADRFYIVLSGQISLRLPGKRKGMSMLIDELTEGDMFGGCVSTALDAYALNARCTDDSEILMISVSALRGILDEDPRVGYMVQARISEIYFRRYIEVMEKLQAIVTSIPM